MPDACTEGGELGAGSVAQCSEGSVRAGDGLWVRLRDLGYWLKFTLKSLSSSLTRLSYDDGCCSPAFKVVLSSAGCRLLELGALDALVRRSVGTIEGLEDGASRLDPI